MHDGQLYNRITQCPSGYELVRDEGLPEFDDCRKCEKDTYGSNAVQWGQSMGGCLACEKGATCLGGDTIQSKADHWRLQYQHADGYEYISESSCESKKPGDSCLFPKGYFLLGGSWGEPMYCTNISVGLVCARVSKGKERRTNDTDAESKDARAIILRCPPGSCDANNNCLQNRTGPVCGFCKPGFAMTSGGCSEEQCPDEEQLRPFRVAAMTLFVLAALSFYLFLCWRTVFVRVDWFFAQIISALVQVLTYFACFSNSTGDGADAASSIGALVSCLFSGAKWLLSKAKKIHVFLKENHMSEMVKIVVSFVQVLGSFFAFPQVEWPPAFLSILAWAQGFTMIDVLSFPSISCLWAGVGFWPKLQLYTVGPLCMVAAFVLPVCVAFLMGLQQKSVSRWRATLDGFWSNLMFVLFFIYPAISLGSMLAFNCDSQVRTYVYVLQTLHD